MRLDKRRMLAGLVVLIGVGMAVGACRSSAPGGGVGDSAGDSSAVPVRTDSAPASGAAGGTVRSDSVLLRTDKAQYKAGEQVALTIENRSASSYAFNPCTRSLEREDGGSWTPIPEPDRMCTMEAWILDARGTRTGKTELPSSLAAGRYRVVVRLTVETPGAAAGSAITAVSEPINIS
jgi:hypothetical protein